MRLTEAVARNARFCLPVEISRSRSRIVLFARRKMALLACRCAGRGTIFISRFGSVGQHARIFIHLWRRYGGALKKRFST